MHDSSIKHYFGSRKISSSAICNDSDGSFLLFSFVFLFFFYSFPFCIFAEEYSLQSDNHKNKDLNPGTKEYLFYPVFSAGYFRYIPPKQKSRDPYRASPERLAIHDRSLHAGIWTDTDRQSSRSFVYRISGGIFIPLGESKNISKSQGSPEGKFYQNQIFLPGDSLYGGIQFCEDNQCSLGIGRFDFLQSASNQEKINLFLNKKLDLKSNPDASNFHGPASGIALRISRQNIGTITFIPYHAPYLSGSYISNSSINGPDSESITYGKERFYAGLKHSKTNENSRGHSIHYLFTGQHFVFSFLYNVILQKETSSHIHSVKKPEDRIESAAFTAGGGFSSFNYEANLFLSLERSYGYYRSPARNQNGKYQGEIDGLLLRMEFNSRLRRFYINGSLILPEPQTRTPGPLSDLKEKSGYIGYGNTMIHSPLLKGSLDFTPFPVICSDRNECNGLRIQHTERSWTDHAAVFFLNVSGRIRNVMISFSGERAVPLKARSNKKKNPFRNAASDANLPRFTEFSAGLQPYRAEAFQFRVMYSRIYRDKIKFKNRILAGESISILFAASF